MIKRASVKTRFTKIYTRPRVHHDAEIDGYLKEGKRNGCSCEALAHGKHGYHLIPSCAVSVCSCACRCVTSLPPALLKYS